jgi:hypothetical protein
MSGPAGWILIAGGTVVAVPKGHYWQRTAQVAGLVVGIALVVAGIALVVG